MMPPDCVTRPVNDTLPAAVIEIVPELIVNGWMNEIDPLVTEINSVAATVLETNATGPLKVAEPVVTTIRAIQVAVAVVPPMFVVPLMFAMPALTFSAAMTAALGWLTLRPLLTVSVTAALPSVSEVAVAETSKSSESAVMLVFAVTTAPAIMFRPPNAVCVVPAIVLVPATRTLEVPGVNVPPLFVQLPAKFSSAEPGEKVPAVNMKFPLRATDVVLPPTLRVPAVLFTVRAPKVCVAAVPLIV